MLKDFALLGLEQTLNMALNLDPDLPQRLIPLQNKVLQIEITGTPFIFSLTPKGHLITLQAGSDLKPDCIIRGSFIALTQLGLAKDFTATRESLNNIEMQGDLELAQAFKKLMSELDIDWEEGLSNIVGDVIAHQVGRGVRGAWAWTQQSAKSLQMNLTEYLQEEAMLMPPRAELEDFYHDVDKLRLDVERLEARINVLL